MKNDVDKIINDFFMPHTVKKSADQLTINELFSLVKEVESALPLFEQEQIETPQQRKPIIFPQMRITENWGKPSNQDRDIIERFTKNIEGSNLKEKISSINTTLENIDKNSTISKVLSSLVILNCFKSLRNDFSPGSAGMLFESFIAALFGQDYEQVFRKHGEKDNIEDVKSKDGKYYSLKFLSPTTKPEGSYERLRDFFERNESITYLIARKEEKGFIDFSEIVITRENVDSKIQTLESNNKRFFIIRDENDSEFIGRIVCSEQFINKKAKQCVKVLKKDFTSIYNVFHMLSESIDTYFTTDDGKEANECATKAANQAHDLQSKFSVLADPKNLKS